MKKYWLETELSCPYSHKNKAKLAHKTKQNRGENLTNSLIKNLTREMLLLSLL